MCSTLHLTDVLTTRSIADYTELTAVHPELPKDLNNLFEMLAADDTRRHIERDTCIRILIKHLRDPESGTESVQLWLLWMFAPVVDSLARKYQKRSRPYAQVASDATWCLLEALNHVNCDQPYLARNIARDAGKQLFRSYGLAVTVEEPGLVPLDDLLESGWDPASPMTPEFLRDLNLSAEDMYMLAGQYIYGFSQAEIAEHLGISYSALKQRMHRLVLKIRRMKK